MFKSKGVNKHEVEVLEAEASKLEAHGQYAQAAENYARVAEAYLDDNVLIHIRYCHEAFRMRLKAKDVQSALEQAQAALRVLDDTGWLKKSMEQVLGLTQMIDEMKAAGYDAEAGSFAGELNEKLGELGLMLKPAPSPHAMTRCPSCGAPLPTSSAGNEVKCTFCGYVLPVG